MRVNEYNSFEEFYEEYNYDRDVFSGHYIGIEFKYNDKYYRLSHDYSLSDESHIYKYFSFELVKKNDAYFNGESKVIGQYKNLNDALDNWIIDGKPFREVIMDDNTQILDKD